jgi:hypothetical protein
MDSVMERYCLDSNIYIEMKNGPYGFDIAPGFWMWVEHEAEAGVLYSPEAVHRELLSYKDELSEWIRTRQATSLFADPPNREVQGLYRQVGDFVQTSYPSLQVADFLSGADPWVIAQAWNDRSIVVTHEARVDASSRKPKIPNICEHFGIRYIKLYDLLRIRGARLGG